MQTTLAMRETVGAVHGGAVPGGAERGGTGRGTGGRGGPNAAERVRPWYRHRWPWLLAIAPAAALLGGIVTLWLAVTTSDSLVVDDYYREGRAINQQLARDRLAAALGLRADLRFGQSGAAGWAVGDASSGVAGSGVVGSGVVGSGVVGPGVVGPGGTGSDGTRSGGTGAVIELQLSAARGSAWPPELRLRIVHATIASLDREYRLEHVGDGRYRAAGSAPEAGGRWLVQLEDAGRTWRLVAPAVTHFDAPLALQADAQ